MLISVLTTVVTAACIGIPAYAFNWSVDIDDRTKANQARIEAFEKAEERERKISKERHEAQHQQIIDLRDDLKHIIREELRR